MSNARNLARLLPNASGQLPDAAMASGSVLQVVQGLTNTQVSTTGSSDVATGVTASITPTSATSKILIIVSAYLRAANSGGNCFAYPKLWRGAIGSGSMLVNGFAMVGSFNNSDFRGACSITYLDSPATITSTTYNLSMSALYANTVYAQENTSPSTITLMEIAG